MALISVIVPIYNVEKYIYRCVDSILAQTFSDFELILIDDESPDKCPKICDRYAEQDERIHVIHQKNGGLSAARNAGIDWVFLNSDSQWITFVDSDDWIHPQMLEILYGAVLKYSVSVSICGYQCTDGSNPQIDRIYEKIWSPEEFYVQKNVNATVAWGKLYKRECFSKLRYPEGKLHEDEFITYQIIFSHAKIVVVEAPLYAYFQNPTGIMKSEWNPKRLDGLEARREQIDYFKRNHFKKAEIRAAKAMLWGIKEQLEIVSSLHKMSYMRKLKISLRKNIHEHKKLLDLSPENTADLYEAAYPNRMKVYWLWKAILRKMSFHMK